MLERSSTIFRPHSAAAV